MLDAPDSLGMELAKEHRENIRLTALLAGARAEIERLEEEVIEERQLGTIWLTEKNALHHKATRYREALEQIRDGGWNWPKTAREIAAEALEKTR